MWRIRPQKGKLSKIEKEREEREKQQEKPKKKLCQEFDVLLLWQATLNKTASRKRETRNKVLLNLHARMRKRKNRQKSHTD